MCGIVAVLGAPDGRSRVEAMSAVLRHRGPDGEGVWEDNEKAVALAHRRLSIIDLSNAAAQPMVSADGRYVIVLNGEIYNYVELRRELADYPFRSSSDTEVLLAAWARWGEQSLDRLIGMFAFVVWDREQHVLTAIRDRFGVKPLFWATRGDELLLASEIRALHAGGIAPRPDESTWATYLLSGHSDHTGESFWEGIQRVPPGHLLTCGPDRAPSLRCWYDLAKRCRDFDDRSIAEVRREYLELLDDSVRLRFRADVPVGVNLSGGLDSSLLLALVPGASGAGKDITAFSYVTGDERYDELPWMEHMRGHTNHVLHLSKLTPDDVPALAVDVAHAVQEPYGGIPTLAYGKLFRTARANGTIVLLDGQGMDEQWGGYDYYQSLESNSSATRLQGSADPATRPECLAPELRDATREYRPPEPFPDRLRNLQWQDLNLFKLQRALRFSDRVSMAASTELREPFLDHRLVELALRQPADRKIRGGVRKWLMREIAADLLPDEVRLAAKRPLQTPQREWLRGPLRSWAEEGIERALAEAPTWFQPAAVRAAWSRFVEGVGDNSFWVWQWLSVSWIEETARPRA